MLVNGSLAVGILASLRFRITCFSAVGITNSRFSLSRIANSAELAEVEHREGLAKRKSALKKSHICILF